MAATKAAAIPESVELAVKVQRFKRMLLENRMALRLFGRKLLPVLDMEYQYQVDDELWQHRVDAQQQLGLRRLMERRRFRALSMSSKRIFKILVKKRVQRRK